MTNARWVPLKCHCKGLLEEVNPASRPDRHGFSKSLLTATGWGGHQLTALGSSVRREKPLTSQVISHSRPINSQVLSWKPGPSHSSWPVGLE